MGAISLWTCLGVLEAQVALIAAFSWSVPSLVSLIFLLTKPTDSLKGLVQVSLLSVKQNTTVFKVAVGSFEHVGRCHVLLKIKTFYFFLKRKY